MPHTVQIAGHSTKEDKPMSIFWVNGQPTQRPEDWKQGLADPIKHWKQGASAWVLAHCWEAAQGFPPEICQLLEPTFPGIKVQKGLVEHVVPMPAQGQGSQNDLFIQAVCSDTHICVAVEGKVGEAFGETISKWHSGTVNKEERLSEILKIIGLPRSIPDTIYYQLLHRMASPVIEARETLHARHAVMVIHSFSQSDAHFEDFAAFLSLYGVENPQVGSLYYLKTVDNVKLYAGWARGDQRFL